MEKEVDSREVDSREVDSSADKYRFVYKHFRVMNMQGTVVDDDKITMTPANHLLVAHYTRGKRGKSKWIPDERGGMTTCYMYQGDSNLVAVGLAECSPKDQFCYRTGRMISKGRAIAMRKTLAAVSVEEGKNDDISESDD